MQDKFCSSSQFLQRTDFLADALGVLLRELPEKIGISERSMFGYRSGKYPVTAKALRKLEAAERGAGVKPSIIYEVDENAGYEAKVKEEPAIYGKKPAADLPWQVGLVSAMNRIAAALEGIERKLKDSD